MEVGFLESLVSSVGFPVACLIGMGWFIVWKEKTYNDTIKEVNTKNTETMNKMSEALNNNTNVMHQILTVLQKDYVKKKG